MAFHALDNWPEMPRNLPVTGPKTRSSVNRESVGLNNEALRLAELLCSRLCHDLSGPLGTLVGMIEIAREERTDSETLDLADATVAHLVNRLRLLRAAWGHQSEELDLGRLHSYAGALSDSRRLTVDLDAIELDAVVPADASRLILNALLLAAESLPSGGTIVLAGSPTDSLVVTIAGANAGWPPGFAACLVDEAAAVAGLTSARRIQGPLTALIARSLGVRLSFLMPLGASSQPPPLLLSFT
jgi:histidine phosphotransferase ChpT